jgi:hypothetical protein
MLSDDDIAWMTDACRELAEPVGDAFVDDYLTNLVVTVIDFQTNTTAAERALEHFATHPWPWASRSTPIKVASNTTGSALIERIQPALGEL